MPIGAALWFLVLKVPKLVTDDMVASVDEAVGPLWGYRNSRQIQLHTEPVYGGVLHYAVKPISQGLSLVPLLIASYQCDPSCRTS